MHVGLSTCLFYLPQCAHAIFLKHACFECNIKKKACQQTGPFPDALELVGRLYTVSVNSLSSPSPTCLVVYYCDSESLFPL